MNNRELFVGTALFGSLVAVGIIAIKFGMLAILRSLSKLDPRSTVILVLISAALLLCSFIIAGAIRAAGRQSADAARNAQRARFYQSLLDAVGDPSGTGSELNANWEATLFLIAGTSVVREFRKWKDLAKRGESTSPETARQFHRLVLAMRRDLGQSTAGLEFDPREVRREDEGRRSDSGYVGAPESSGLDFAAPAIRLTSQA